MPFSSQSYWEPVHITNVWRTFAATWILPKLTIRSTGSCYGRYNAALASQKRSSAYLSASMKGPSLKPMWKESCQALFPLTEGLNKGQSVLSSILFNIFFGALIRAFEAECAKEESKSKVSLGVHIKYNIAEGFMSPAYIKDAAAPNVRSQVLYDILYYADDCVLVGSSQEGMQIMVTTFDRVAREFGMEVAIKKNQVIANKFLTRKLALTIVPPPSMPAHAITRDGPAYRLRKRVKRPKAPTPTDGKPRVEIGETILEVVEQFKYLGCQDSASATLTAEIIKRKMAM